MKYLIISLVSLLSFLPQRQGGTASDQIVGKWMSEDNNLEVEIYKTGAEYRAKVLWFDDTDDKTKPMSTRSDEKNPNKELRTRKIIGLEVLTGLKYSSDDEEWQDGKIYDSSSGKSYNAKVSMTSDGQLKVRAYWHVSFLGQNMYFKKV